MLKSDRKTRSIALLLLPWLLPLPGHQQAWHWWCRTNSFLAFHEEGFQPLCHLNLEKLKEIQINHYIPQIEFSRTRVNSLVPTIFEWNFTWVIFKIILAVYGWCISCEMALKFISLDLADDKSALVQVMAWCRQATSHYLSQCWPSSMSPYGVVRLQWVNVKTSWLTAPSHYIEHFSFLVYIIVKIKLQLISKWCMHQLYF